MVDGSEGAQDDGTYSEKVLVTLWATGDSFYPSLSLSLSSEPLTAFPCLSPGLFLVMISVKHYKWIVNIKGTVESR